MSDFANGVRIYAIFGGYDGVNIPSLAVYLNDSVDILSFWNHIPLLYCVKTKLDIAQFRQKLQPFFLNNNFLVAEIQAHRLDGILPMAAWDWFHTPAPPDKRRTDLTSLFGLLESPK